MSISMNTWLTAFTIARDLILGRDMLRTVAILHKVTEKLVNRVLIIAVALVIDDHLKLDEECDSLGFCMKGDLVAVLPLTAKRAPQ